MNNLIPFYQRQRKCIQMINSGITLDNR